VTKVSSSGAYVHNLWAGNISMWPNEQRQTYFYKPHDTDIVDRSAVNQNDDRYYNNIFVGGMGTSALDAHGFTMKASGNVFLGGAKPFRHNQQSFVSVAKDPSFQLTEEVDGWWLKMNVEPAWGEEIERNVVTTELLGEAVVTGAPYEQRDGTPYQLDADFFGNKRLENGPAPGPFQVNRDEAFRFKVWSKVAGSVKR